MTPDAISIRCEAPHPRGHMLCNRRMFDVIVERGTTFQLKRKSEAPREKGSVEVRCDRCGTEWSVVLVARKLLTQ